MIRPGLLGRPPNSFRERGGIRLKGTRFHSEVGLMPHGPGDAERSYLSGECDPSAFSRRVRLGPRGEADFTRPPAWRVACTVRFQSL
jgi:hypothetical protein